MSKRAEDKMQQHIDALLRQRLAELANSFLTMLASQAQEEIVVAGKKIVLSVWHDLLPSAEHRIVVQLYARGALGIGRMSANGFAVTER